MSDIIESTISPTPHSILNTKDIEINDKAGPEIYNSAEMKYGPTIYIAYAQNLTPAK
jgi:hypothetical protein